MLRLNDYIQFSKKAMWPFVQLKMKNSIKIQLLLFIPGSYSE